MKRLLAFFLAFMLLTPCLHAFPFVDDPGVVYLLGIVNDVLKAIENVELTVHVTLQNGIRGILREIGFPHELFRSLDRTISEVVGIRGELQALSCAWQFSPRTAMLRELYFNPTRLCRDGFQAVWGRSIPVVDADRKEFRDYLGTLSTNMVSSRVDRVEGWRQLFPDMEAASALERVSPGEANRDEAVSLAGAARLAASNSAIATQSLLIEQMSTAEERLALRRELDLGRFLILETSGADPWTIDGP